MDKVHGGYQPSAGSSWLSSNRIQDNHFELHIEIPLELVNVKQTRKPKRPRQIPSDSDESKY